MSSTMKVVLRPMSDFERVKSSSSNEAAPMYVGAAYIKHWHKLDEHDLRAFPSAKGQREIRTGSNTCCPD